MQCQLLIKVGSESLSRMLSHFIGIHLVSPELYCSRSRANNYCNLNDQVERLPINFTTFVATSHSYSHLIKYLGTFAQRVYRILRIQIAHIT